jgi:hypothetical protein
MCLWSCTWETRPPRRARYGSPYRGIEGEGTVAAQTEVSVLERSPEQVTVERACLSLMAFHLDETSASRTSDPGTVRVGSAKGADNVP